MMNRRRFLALLPVPFLPAATLAATDDDIGTPVEPCPCCCSDDDGVTVTLYSCDDYGAPLPGDPANCGTVIEDCSVNSEELVFVDDELHSAADVPMSPEITQLPSTGTGSSLSTGRSISDADGVSVADLDTVLRDLYLRYGKLAPSLAK